MLYSSPHAFAPPACLRLVSSCPFHLIDCRFDRRLPALRHGWAGREAGSVCVLLAWLCPIGWADVDSRFIPFPLRCPLGLLARRFGCVAMVFSSHALISSVRYVLRCPACLSARPVSRLVRRLVGRVGSSRPSLAPSCDTMGGESAVAVRLRRAFVPHPDFLPPVSSPCACLPRGVPLSHPMMWMVADDWRSVGSACCPLACLPRCIRAVPPLVISGRLLRELVKTARAEMASSLPPPFLFPAICVSPRPPFYPRPCDCLTAGRRLVPAFRSPPICVSLRPSCR